MRSEVQVSPRLQTLVREAVERYGQRGLAVMMALHGTGGAISMWASGKRRIAVEHVGPLCRAMDLHGSQALEVYTWAGYQNIVNDILEFAAAQDDKGQSTPSGRKKTRQR